MRRMSSLYQDSPPPEAPQPTSKFRDRTLPLTPGDRRRSSQPALTRPRASSAAPDQSNTTSVTASKSGALSRKPRAISVTTSSQYQPDTESGFGAPNKTTALPCMSSKPSLLGESSSTPHELISMVTPSKGRVPSGDMTSRSIRPGILSSGSIRPATPPAAIPSDRALCESDRSGEGDFPAVRVRPKPLNKPSLHRLETNFGRICECQNCAVRLLSLGPFVLKATPGSANCIDQHRMLKKLAIVSFPGS